MEKYEKIIDKTKKEDENFKKNSKLDLEKIKIEFKVPETHQRNRILREYYVEVLPLEKIPLEKEAVFIIDKGVASLKFVETFLKDKKKMFLLSSKESETKTVSFLNKFIQDNLLQKNKIIVIGGGLIINCGAYIAEKTQSDWIAIPTTVLAMADAAIGGKVRVNEVSERGFIKHKFKSFYEPNAIYLDWRFVQKIKGEDFTEIIKHSLFQSEELYNFLIQNYNSKTPSPEFTKKAIIWNIFLKKICLEIDEEEKPNGSARILRAGHEISDRLEEIEKFRISHNQAVSIGMYTQLRNEKNTKKLASAERIFELFHLPKTLEEVKTKAF